MTALTVVLRNHIAFNIWASRRLVEAARQLAPEQRERDFGTADRSVQGTLLHLYRSERTWLQRLLPVALQEAQLPAEGSWEALTEGWPMVQEAWRAWIDNLDETEVDRMVHYKDSKQQPWSEPLWQIVLHVVNHSTHHRGQVMGFLRALGTAPPPLDFIFYIRLGAIPR